MTKFICIGCVLIVATALQSGCYALKQAYWQNNLFNSRVPIEQAKHDPTISEDQRHKIALADRVRQFARQQGLEVGDSYGYYIHNQGDYVSYLVQAAEATQLKWRTWWFPIVGRVPYLGFFSESDRNEMARKLSADGYDVHAGGATAFSGLGWFDDPLYASMLGRSSTRLAETIFHELTHRTIWFPGELEFNEPFAEFIAERMTREWLEQQQEHQELQKYLVLIEERVVYARWVGKLRLALSELYRGAEISGLDRKGLLAKKHAIFQQFVHKELPEFRVLSRSAIVAKDWNNATVLASSLYDSTSSRLSQLLGCTQGRRVQQLIADLKRELGRAREPWTPLARICASP